MHVPQNIKDRIQKIAEGCVTKAEKHFGRKYNMPRIEYTVRGRIGGYARNGELVNFNPILLMENLQDYYDNTVPHEVAHIIDSQNGDNQRKSWDILSHRRAKRSIHGPTWQTIMRVFGCEPDRCHTMDTTNAAVRTKTKYEYQCVTCRKPYFVSSVRHNKQRRHALTNPGASFYTCIGCGRARGALTFVANRGQVSFEQARRAANESKPIKFEFDHIPPHKLPPKLREEVGMSSVDRARKIYSMYSHLGRQVCIRKMVEIGLKETTSSTYYQNFRSGK